MRYYYTDTLAAAWMAKHFRMKFQKTDLSEFCFGDAQDILDDLINHEDGNFYGDGGYYIHPESLSLLDVKSGDIIESVSVSGFCTFGAAINDGDASASAIAVPKDSSTRIIRRVGIAFMWPEVENGCIKTKDCLAL